jgi:type I restriction enzyme S subunit
MTKDTMTDKWVLPKGWMWTKLGEICDEVEKAYPKANPNDEFLYIDIASIDNKQQKILQPKRYLGRDAPSRARQLVRSGDILFSTVRTYLKNIAMVNEVYDGQIASTGFCVIRPFSEADNRFFFFLTQTDDFLNPLTQLQRGTSYPAVRDSDVFDSFIPLPPLTEQHCIVAKIEELFTELDAGVEALQKVKAQLKRYRQAVLKHAFEGKLTELWREAHRGELEPASVLLERIRAERAKTLNVGARAPRSCNVDTSSLPQLPEGWVWATVGDLLRDKPQNGLYKSIEYFDDNKGVRFLDIKGLYMGFYADFRGARKVRIDESEVEKYSLIPNDLLVNRVSKKPEGVGKTVVVKNLEELTVFESNMIRIRLNFRIACPYFVNYFLNSTNGRIQVLASAKMTQQASINQNDVVNIAIPLPPLVEQHQSVEEIERRFSIADEVEQVVEQSLKQAERLRQSILKRAFEGKLVPQDPNDEPADKLLERIKQAKSKM